MRDLENTGKNEGDLERDDDLQAALDSLGADSDGSVQVWRFQDGAFAMLDRIAARDFDPWTIGKKYGPGRYRFDLKNGRGKYVKKALERYIAVPENAPVAAPASAPAFPGGFDPISMLVESSRRAETFQNALMLALIQNLGVNRGAAPAGPGLGLQDIVAVMREARESATVPAPPHETMLSLLREGMTLGREIEGNPAGESPSGAMALFPKLLDVIAKVLPAHGTAAPAASATASTAALSLERAINEDPVNALLGMFAPQMIQAASSGQDPTAFARMVVGITPRGPMLGALRSLVFATTDQRRAAFSAGAPELLTYAKWIDRACEAARGFLAPTGRASEFPRPTPSVPEVPMSAQPLEVPAPSSGDVYGCDDAECSDAACTNLDHYDGCDDEQCSDPECIDPTHYDDERLKLAALQRQSEAEAS